MIRCNFVGPCPKCGNLCELPEFYTPMPWIRCTDSRCGWGAPLYKMRKKRKTKDAKDL